MKKSICLLIISIFCGQGFGETINVLRLKGHGGSSIYGDIVGNASLFGSDSISYSDYSGEVTLSILNEKAPDVLVISNPSGGNDFYSETEKNAILEYLNQEDPGRGILGEGYVFNSIGDTRPKLHFLGPIFGFRDGIVYANVEQEGTFYIDPTYSDIHLFEGFIDSYSSSGYLRGNIPEDGGWSATNLNNAVVVASNTNSVITVYDASNYRAVYISVWSAYTGSLDDQRMIYNAYSSIYHKDIVSDADKDGLSDDDEVDIYGTDPLNADSDDDGLMDGAEVNTHGTDPLDPDSDGDGLSDGEEVQSTNYCLEFNGIDENSSGLGAPATNTFTVECWVNVTASHQIDPERNSGVSGSNQNYLLQPGNRGVENAGMGISVGSNGVSVYEHGEYYLPALLVWQGSLSGWTHIAVVYDNKTPSLYINGTWVRTGLTSLRSMVFPVANLGGGTYGYFSGQVDDFRIWNDIRTEAEIVGDMSSSLLGTESGLVRSYSFNQGGGSVVEDETGLADLSLSNMDDSDWVLVDEGTNPLDYDSDDDGLNDGNEVNLHGTDPLDADSDDDGLSDGDEVNTHGTSPNESDSDRDGLDDNEELFTYSTDPTDGDMDRDGLNDGQEILTYGTSPILADSDSDGFNDGFEVDTGFDPALDSSTPDLHSEILTSIQFQFNAATNVSYRIEATESLSSVWEVVETDIIGKGQKIIRHYSIQGQDNRFFRAKRN